MRVRMLTVVTGLAFAVVAFSAGVLADAALAPATLEIPDSLPETISRAGSVTVLDVGVSVAVGSAHGDADALQTSAAIGALVAGAFLLVRFAVLVVRRSRPNQKA